MNATWLTLFKIAGGDVIAVIVHFLYNILKSPMFISIVAGGFIAGVALFCSNYLYRLLVSPKLGIDEDEISETMDGYIRVKVKNEGKTSADNCVGKISFNNVCEADLLELPEIITDITPVRFRPIKEMKLIWANTDSENITINAHDNEVLSVLRKAPSYESAIGVVKKTFDRWCLLKSSEGKEYLGKISVTAANAKGTEINFSIKSSDGKIKMVLF